MTIMSAALILLTGMYILTFLYHLVITIMKRGDRLHLFFALMALAISVYAPGNLLLYRTESVAQYMFIQRIQMYSVALFMVSLVWFAAYYTGFRPKRFLYIFSAVYAVFIFARSLSPTLLIFEKIRGIGHFTLPWGEQIAMLDSDATLFLPLYYLMIVAVYVFVFTAAYRQYRSGEKIKALVLTGAMTLFILASINDMLVLALSLNWLWLADFGFTSLMVLMSLNLSADLVQASKIKQQLVDNEKKFRAIFNSTYQFIGMLDCEGRIIDANTSSLRFAGARPEEIAGRFFWDTPWWSGLPAEQEKLKNAVSRAAAGEFIRFETVNRRENGALHVIDFSLQPVRDAEGKVLFLVPEGRDISEQKRAELTITQQVSELKRLNDDLNATIEELQATNEEFEAQNIQLLNAQDEITRREQEYRRLVENVPAMIFRMSIPEGKITYVSNAAYDIFGYRPEELYENSALVFDVIHPDSKGFVVGRWDILLKGGLPINFEFKIIHRSGEPRWVYQRSVPVKDRNGAVVSVEGILADISDLKKAEAALSESEERMLSFMNSASDSFYLLDAGLNFLEINRKGLEIMGREREDVVGKNLADMVPDVKSSGRYDRHLDVIRTGEPYIVEDFVPHPVFGDMHFILKSFRVGSGLGVIASDISGRKKAEEKVQASLLEKEVLLRELYHRTKNNMQVITSLLNLQSNYFENGEVREVFEEMENRIHSMAMVHQKLYQSQNLASINLKEYTQELALLLLQSYGARGGLVTVQCDASDVFVQIDVAVPYGLVLNELVSNALKHAFPGGRAGEIVIGLSRIDGGKVELSVSDNGVGVPAGFDFKARGRLGQQIIFSIVEHQLRGEVRYESKEGVTCRVRFKEEIYVSRI